jgi:hypothetical protein
VGVDECTEAAQADASRHSGHEEGQLGPDTRGEGTEHQEFRLKPRTGFRVPGGADPPTLALGIQEQRRVEIRGIVRGRANGGGGQPGDCRGRNGCQFDRFSSHRSTVDCAESKTTMCGGESPDRVQMSAEW